MKQYNFLLILLVAIAVTFSSCEVIGDIFQAGMAVGIIAIIVIVALVIWLISRFRR